MTQDQIIEMAIAAELIDHRDTAESLPRLYVQSLNDFAALVRNAALEEAVSVCEEASSDSGGEKYDMFGKDLATQCAYAIRQLKETK